MAQFFSKNPKPPPKPFASGQGSGNQLTGSAAEAVRQSQQYGAAGPTPTNAEEETDRLQAAIDAAAALTGSADKLGAADTSGVSQTLDRLQDLSKLPPQTLAQMQEQAAEANALIIPPTIGTVYYLTTMTDLFMWPSSTDHSTWQPWMGLIHDEFSWIYRTSTTTELDTSVLADSMSIAFQYSEASPLNSNYNDGEGYAMNIYAVEPPYPYGNTGWGIFFNDSGEPRHYGDSIERDGLRRKNGAPEDLQVANSEDREYIFDEMEKWFQQVRGAAGQDEARSTYKKIIMDEPFRGEELFSIVENERLQFSVTGPLFDELNVDGDPSLTGGGY